MAATKIPTFYWFVFRVMDPFFCTLGFLNHIKPDKSAAVALYNPEFTSPIALETRLILDWMASFFLLLGLLQFFLLRARPHDVEIWKILQGCTAVLDLVTIVACLRAVNEQGRLDPRLWAPGENQNIWGNVSVLLARTAFCFGIGLSRVHTKKNT